ncbi:MAG: YeiH family protein [Gemmatimonas sp.]
MPRYAGARHDGTPVRFARTLLPGLALASGLAVVAAVVARWETRHFGHPVVEALVVAILLGMIVRSSWRVPEAADPGIRFAAKRLLEVAVLLMGLSVDLPLLVSAGTALAVGIVLLVVLGLGLSYALGRALGLPDKLAVLVACGNAICGNSAIAAVAPVIGADAEQVGSAIAFTAILGVGVVLGLPLLVGLLDLSHYQYGVLAGLTVYAVPQVLAAAFPVSALSGQVGTLVKLVRVLMLGPVVLFFAVRGTAARAGDAAAGLTGATPPAPGGVRGWVTAVGRYVPWFIAAFLLLAGARAAGLVPTSAVTGAREAAAILTIVAMAALGLGCDLRAIAGAGRAIVMTVVGSLGILIGLSVALIRLLGIR